MSQPLLTQRQFLLPTKQATQIRCLNLYEYQSKQLISKYNVNVQRFVIADSVEQAENAAAGLKANEIVIKAQIHAGGRGKGEFSSGLKSGIHFTKDPAKVPGIVSEMLGYKLKTKQTSGDGALVSKVMVAEALKIVKETYFAILLDRESGGPALVGCPKGGMDIEQLTKDYPDHIYKTPIDIETGPTENQVSNMAMKLGFQGKAVSEAAEQMHRLYEVFMEVDATQIEINPFGSTPDNKVCFDAKISFDDNATFKHPEWQSMRDRTEEDPREIEAEEYGLNYVGLDGNIGCLVNGAGLALATMDIIKLHGAMPANFLDVGGDVTPAQVSQAFKILTEDKNVKAILVNIFGDIASCQTIAEGIVAALTEGPRVKVPIVVRMQGISLLLTVTPSPANAQSENCLSCIKRAIPTVTNCEALSSAQYAVIEKLIHGANVHTSVEQYKVAEPVAYNCLVSLMWDIVHYKAKLWGTCLQPKTACPWPEMMHYMEMIPKVASIYGVKNPPSQVLVDGPA
ncbi:Succinate--CoA ligase [GDP-forming] subunit beta, mitochondrial [Mortierella sp. AM989]|nr:Succinate--CoA ligase [GDP-forming] subunit beta, mitochondrial [Mortierella sp. AM989]